MKIPRFLSLLFIAVLTFASCGGSESPASKPNAPGPKSMIQKNGADPMEDKGIGPVKEVKFDPEVNAELAAKGEEIYKKMCVACHKPDQKFIGPAQKGVLDRRSPEWVMNMILNPEEMVQKDPIAMELLKEFNGVPMANQNLKQEEARAILEYFRTL